MSTRARTIRDYIPVRAFIRKKFFWYIIPNLLLNSIIPYFSFKNPAAVSLFNGEFCFARFVLPMALFIPFAITVDFLKKLTEFMRTINLNDLLNSETVNMRQFLRFGLYNGLITFLIAFSLLFIAYELTPTGFTYNGLLLAGINGIASSFMAVYFVFWSLRKLDELIKIYTDTKEKAA